MLLVVIVFALFLFGIVSMVAESQRRRGRGGADRSGSNGSDAFWMHHQGGMPPGHSPLHDDGCPNVGGFHDHGHHNDHGHQYGHGGHHEGGGHHDGGSGGFDGGGASYDGGGGGFDGGGFDGGGGCGGGDGG
jgi:hypothetical protein